MNFPVTAKYFNIYEQILGYYMGALKLNTTRPTPKLLEDDTIEIPPEIREIHKYIIFCFYIMCVKGIHSMNGIYTKIKYRSREPLSNMKYDK